MAFVGRQRDGHRRDAWASLCRLGSKAEQVAAWVTSRETFCSPGLNDQTDQGLNRGSQFLDGQQDRRRYVSAPVDYLPCRV